MNFGHYNITVLILLIVLLYPIFNWLLNLIDRQGFKKFQAPSIVTIISGVILLINNSLWDIKPFNPILIDVPVISGKYTGRVDIRHLDTLKNEMPEVEVKIKQTGTSTYFDLYSKGGSHSRGIISDLIKENGIWYLYTIYSNENNKNPENKNIYEGTSKFEISIEKDSTILKGRFYTDDSRKSYGTIYLKKEN
jgi:hypothetical protein